MATEIKINVRGLVEFIFRAGDIDNRRTGAKEKSAMEAGSRIHRKIQKQMGGSYESEVTLRHSMETELYSLIIEGRADGIFSESYESFKEKVEARDYLPQFNDMLAGRFPGGNHFLSVFRDEDDEDDDLNEFDLSEEIDFSLVGSDHKLPAAITVIDEIKGIYRDPLRMEEPVPVHVLCLLLCHEI